MTSHCRRSFTKNTTYLLVPVLLLVVALLASYRQRGGRCG
jgi:hypothetical protein